MKTKKQILRITQTAMLLGLTVAAQYYLTGILSFNPFISQIVVGSLVNMFLILAALICGFWSGISISALVPFISFAIGRMPHVWMIPFVILGNSAIVLIFWAVCRKKIFGSVFTVNWAVASIMGALLKFGVLWVGVTKIFINFILINDTALKAPQIAKMTSVISFNYSFPQLATALIGSILVYLTYPVLKKAINNDDNNNEKKIDAKN
ncbi:MAG: hypothetical protein FWF92_07220 [Oscillospiraceae bacterium]|nr:hypothetical protein [Oscillospiraceae bacterium]